MQVLLPIIAVIIIAAQPAPAPQGTIRGRVLDPDGRLMRDVQIGIMEIRGGEFRTTRSFTIRGDGTFDTAVPAGRILLVAQPRPRVVGDEPRLRRFVTHPPAYFPGVFDQSDAWPIDVKPGEIVELDFTMPPLPIGSIKAMVTGPDGYSLDQVRAMRPEANQIRTSGSRTKASVTWTNSAKAATS